MDMFSSRSGVMHIPFQMQSMFLELSSISLASQLMTMKLASMPRSAHTALASSVSKPIRSPVSGSS